MRFFSGSKPLNICVLMRIEANKKSSEASIWIDRYIGSWECDARSLRAALNTLGDTKVIHLHIHSPGGDVFEGTAMFNLLKNHPAKVISYIDGLAASMATIIALAGTEVRMASNALFMIHNPSGSASGEKDEHLKAADLLSKIEGIMSDLYEKKTGLKPERIRKMMAEETWLTANEALALGFVDKVVESNMKAAAAFDLSKVEADKRVEKAYRNFLPENVVHKSPLNMLKIQMALGLADSANEDQIAAAVNSLKKKAEDAEAAFNALSVKLAEAENKRFTDLLDEKVADGSLDASGRTKLEAMAKKSGVEAALDAISLLKPSAPSESVRGKINGGAEGSEKDDRKDWTFDDYRRKDPIALSKMMREDKERYEALKTKYVKSITPKS
jgi:ATP-dependent Clp endopeptidase proteolytic subunit ClpP